ncbi:hypothetical protein [Sanguibacter sp. 25GB23B1]|uniref:hypothetical protein n=1 Tax=unclassified Sanguibacter TaxID=2645534 RepID=UPI0032AF90DB
MALSILLVPSSVTLVPGATGRTDVAHDERESVVVELRRAIAAAFGRTAASSSTPALGPRLTVVAPAPTTGVRTTDDGVPDLGASGLLGDTLSLDVPSRPGVGRSALPAPQPGVRLHTAASVVTVLLRLAGWSGSIRTVEIGGGPPTDTTGPASWPIEAGAHVAPESAEERGLLVFTTVVGDVGTSGSSPSAGTVPSGIPELLLRADRTVTALYRSLVTSVPAS